MFNGDNPKLCMSMDMNDTGFHILTGKEIFPEVLKSPNFSVPIGWVEKQNSRDKSGLSHDMCNNFRNAKDWLHPDIRNILIKNSNDRLSFFIAFDPLPPSPVGSNPPSSHLLVAQV
jgi:hypothetical protein